MAWKTSLYNYVLTSTVFVVFISAETLPERFAVNTAKKGVTQQHKGIFNTEY